MRTLTAEDDQVLADGLRRLRGRGSLAPVLILTAADTWSSA